MISTLPTPNLRTAALKYFDKWRTYSPICYSHPKLSNPRLFLPPPCWYHRQQLRHLLVLLVFSQLQYMYPESLFLLLKPHNHTLVSHPTASPVGVTVTQTIQTSGVSVASSLFDFYPCSSKPFGSSQSCLVGIKVKHLMFYFFWRQDFHKYKIASCLCFMK